MLFWGVLMIVSKKVFFFLKVATCWFGKLVGWRDHDQRNEVPKWFEIISFAVNTLLCISTFFKILCQVSMLDNQTGIAQCDTGQSHLKLFW